MVHESVSTSPADLKKTLRVVGSNALSYSVREGRAVMGNEASIAIGDGNGVSRRTFLVVGSVTAASMSLDPKAALGLDGLFAPGRLSALARPPIQTLKTFSATLRRPDDLIVLEFDFYNLVHRDGWLRRPDLSKEGWIVVHFPAQHVLERAYLLTEGATTEPVPPPGSVDARLSGPSRLAFVAPADGIPFNGPSLLRFGGWVQKVVPSALPAAAAPAVTPVLLNPRPWETAIEAPWWLLLSPNGQSGNWENRTAPLSYNGRTEVWHTNYTPVVRALQASAVRAVWTRDWDLPGFTDPRGTSLACTPGGPGYPFESSLKPRDRAEIVISSAEFAAPDTRPRPLQVNRLTLSTLGASLDVKGEWNTAATGLGLESWIHRSTFARDQYVRVVRVGFLFPLGHRAVQIEVTERRPEFSGLTPGAYLRKRTFIVVRQPVRKYPGAADGFGGRWWPFTSVRLLTAATPNLEPPENLVSGLNSYVPMVGTTPFLFEAIGTDHEGRDIPFATPLVWVEAAKDGVQCAGQPTEMGGLYSPATISALILAYNAIPGGSPRRPDVGFGGRSVAFAPSGTVKGSTSYDTKSVRIQAQLPNLSQPALDGLFSQSEPPFSPLMEFASVRIGPAEVVSKGALPATRIVYNGMYVAHGFGVGEVWALAKPDEPKPQLTFGDGSGGAVVTPNLAIAGLSRKLGPVGSDPIGLDAGSFDPKKFFEGATPKLLGGVPLPDVVKSGNLSKAPVISSRYVGSSVAPTSMETSFDWHPELMAAGKFGLDDQPDLTISGRVVQDLETGKSVSSIRGDLRHVSITLVPGFEFIRIHFNRVAFTAGTGKKSEFVVDLDKVDFLGALSFISELASHIKPPVGAASGPYLDVSPARVLAGMAFALPTVAVGAFVLENVSSRSEVRLPLNGEAVTARFGFSTRDDPFHLTVLGLGGGGFCAIEIGADGPKALDVSLEFGAMVALNLGVAKGKVELFGGLYYRLDGEKSVYEAFVRISGSMSVLGLVTVSAKFYVSLKYDSGNGKFHGSASVTYSISIGFFEKDVTVSVERKFPKKGGDPFLTDRMTPADWNTYCDAYAVGV